MKKVFIFAFIYLIFNQPNLFSQKSNLSLSYNINFGNKYLDASGLGLKACFNIQILKNFSASTNLGANLSRMKIPGLDTGLLWQFEESIIYSFKENPFYLGAGIGYYILSFSSAGRQEEMYSIDENKLGYNANIGYKLTKDFFAEIRFVLLNTTLTEISDIGRHLIKEDVNLNSFSLNIGMYF